MTLLLTHSNIDSTNEFLKAVLVGELEELSVEYTDRVGRVSLVGTVRVGGEEERGGGGPGGCGGGGGRVNLLKWKEEERKLEEEEEELEEE
jgi:hypothetical protein